jgi:hypothetical protein
MPEKVPKIPTDTKNEAQADRFSEPRALTNSQIINPTIPAVIITGPIGI